MEQFKKVPSNLSPSSWTLFRYVFHFFSTFSFDHFGNKQDHNAPKFRGKNINWIRSNTTQLEPYEALYTEIFTCANLPSRGSFHFPAGNTQITSQFIDTALATFCFQSKGDAEVTLNWTKSTWHSVLVSLPQRTMEGELKETLTPSIQYSITLSTIGLWWITMTELTQTLMLSFPLFHPRPAHLWIASSLQNGFSVTHGLKMKGQCSSKFLNSFHRDWI